MKTPSVTDCLDEIRRLRAENARLGRLVESKRPELAALRDLVSAVRHVCDNLPRQLEHIRDRADAMIGTRDDLPTIEELSGIFGEGHARVSQELKGDQGDAETP